jgi:hypothetical protein
MKMDFFRDLMANEELYFRRVDLYKTDDPNEGLPTDAYLRRTLNLERYALDDELQLNHHQASNRLHSECYFLSCWNLDDPLNRLRMIIVGEETPSVESRRYLALLRKRFEIPVEYRQFNLSNGKLMPA